MGLRVARFRSVSAGSTSPALSAHAINSRQLRGVGNQTSGRVSPLSLLEFVRRKSDARVHFNFVQRPPLWVSRPYTRRGQGHEPDSLFYVSPYHQAAHKNLLPYRMPTGWQVNVKLWKTMLQRSLIKFVSTRFMQQMTVVLALRRAFVVWQIERRPIPLQYSCQFRAPSSFTYHSALLLTPIALSKVPWGSCSRDAIDPPLGVNEPSSPTMSASIFRHLVPRYCPQCTHQAPFPPASSRLLPPSSVDRTYFIT